MSADLCQQIFAEEIIDGPERHLPVLTLPVQQGNKPLWLD
jgi:hypothetical protein